MTKQYYLYRYEYFNFFYSQYDKTILDNNTYNVNK